MGYAPKRFETHIDGLSWKVRLELPLRQPSYKSACGNYWSNWVVDNQQTQ